MQNNVRRIVGVAGCVVLLATISLPPSVAQARGKGKQISVSLKNNSAGAKTGGTIKLRPRPAGSIKGNGLVGSSFFLPKGAIVSAQSLSRCAKSRLEKTGKCSKGSLISTGSTKIRTTYEGMENLTASIRLYSGETLGNLLMVVREPMTEITMVIEGTIKGAGSKGYSYEFEFNNLPVEPLGEGSGVFIYPSNMSMKIAGRSLYRNPLNCTKRGWRFGVQFRYEKGGSSPIYGKRLRCRS